MAISRKDFIKTSAFGALGVLFTGNILKAEENPFVKLKGNLYTYNKSGGTILIYQSKLALVVVDSQFPQNVESFIPHFNLSETRKIDFLINTHHHGDHTGGNQILGPFSKKMVAHKRVPELLTQLAKDANKEPGFIPTTTFDATWKQDIGDDTIHAYHFGPAHTGGDAVIYFEKSGIAHTGDLVFNNAHPNIDRKAGASIENWIVYLNKTIETLPKETIYVFGHAAGTLPNHGNYESVYRFRDYLSAVLEKAKAAVTKGMSREEFTTDPILEGFEDVQTVSKRLNLSFVLGIAWDEVRKV